MSTQTTSGRFAPDTITGYGAACSQVLEAIGYGVLITEPRCELPGPIIRFANSTMRDLTGYSVGELVGATPRILQGPETDRAELDRMKDALRQRRAFKGEATNYRKDGSSYVVDWTITPLLDDAGALEAWISVQRDVTERRSNRIALERSEQHLRVLVAELQHRTRNLMGVIRSVADKTAAASAGLGDFRSRFGARLDALARAQGLLSRLNEHDRVTFDELMRTELAAMSGSADRITLDGPAGVRLRSSTVQTLALALHELATNAVKYGAIGQPGGRLAVRWTLELKGHDDRPWLHVDWRESGVRMAAAPIAAAGSGQGRELIEQALPYQLGAHTSFALGPDGVRCTLSVPVSASNAEVDGESS